MIPRFEVSYTSVGITPSVEVLVLPKPIEKEILNLEGAVIGG